MESKIYKVTIAILIVIIMALFVRIGQLTHDKAIHTEQNRYLD